MNKELDILKSQVQEEEFVKYSSYEANAIYKAAILDYIDRVNYMNVDYENSNRTLRNDLEYIENAVKQIDVEN